MVARYRDLIAGHVGDLGGEGPLSESEKSLVRRASAIECELEQMEGRLSRGEKVDLDAFTRAASHLRRILESLGLGRRSRDITPSLAEYLASRPAEPTGSSSDDTPIERPDPEGPTGEVPCIEEQEASQ